jgi:hypothetical protein
MSRDVQEAVLEWCRRYGEPLPRRLSACPFCGSPGGFHAIPGEPYRWYCFSTRHSEGMGGIAGQRGFQGDALDYYLFQNGLETSRRNRMQELQNKGLIGKRHCRREQTFRLPQPPSSPVVTAPINTSLSERKTFLEQLRQQANAEQERRSLSQVEAVIPEAEESVARSELCLLTWK